MSVKTGFANEAVDVDDDVVAQVQRLSAHGALEAPPMDEKNLVPIRFFS